MRPPIALFFLLLAIGPAFAADSVRWSEVHSPHFDVYTDANPSQAHRVAVQLEEMRSVFRSIIPSPGPDGAPIVVLALRDKKGFQTLIPSSYLSQGSLDLEGFFMPTPDRNYILLRLDTEDEHAFATVYHEYTHYMLRTAPWIPLWLNEGLAEFYQNTDIHPKDVEFGQASVDDILYLRQSHLLPLTTLFAVDHDSPYYHEEQKGSIFYAESWALTHYLFVTDRENKTSRLHDYMIALSKGIDPVTAAQQAFGDLNKLKKQLDTYVSNGDYKMFRKQADFSIDEAALKPSSIPATDVNSLRADILVYNDRIADAESLIQSVLHEDPKNALAHESMGYLKFRQNDIPAAKKWYGEAVQLNSSSYLANFYFANMALQAGDTGNDALIETSLQHCIQISPNFAPAYDALARFYASRTEKLDDAHRLNTQAIALDPTNFGYRMNAVQVLLVDQKFPDAIRVLQESQKYAQTPDQQAMIKERIEHLQTYVEAMSHPHNFTAPTDSSPTSTVETTETAVTPDDAPKFPTGAANGPHHTARGILRDVHCYYPAVISFDLEVPAVAARPGKPAVPARTFSVYANNYYKIPFTLANFTQTKDMNPCTDIVGMKALVSYAEVQGNTVKTIAGQIVTVELSK